MALDAFIQEMFPAIENELHNAVEPAGGPQTPELHSMLAYHMGWEGQGAGSEATGKRIRPLLTLLTCAAAGGGWQKALPAAAAVELIHNFSLIHDDIEDNSPLRHGRPTVWKRWSVAQAINAGDAMFTLAHLEILHLHKTTTAEAALHAEQILQETCLNLTKGQYMDLAYEARGDLSLEAYWPMVSGKTAALLSACTWLGALAAGVDEAKQNNYRKFGENLGLAFQAQDDLLGIWGNAEITGKSAASDLLSGKKSLPVLYGLSQSDAFSGRWAKGAIAPEEVPTLAQELKREGAYDYTQETAMRLTGEALQALDNAHPHGEAGNALRELADRLLERKA